MSWLRFENYSKRWSYGVVGGICGATLGLAIWKYLKQKPQENETDSQSLKKWTLVGRIQKLVIYPVKSCPGIEVETATVTRLGLVHESSEFFRDRVFLIVDSKGDFKTLIQFPRLILLRIKVSDEGVEFSAPNSTPFLLRDDVLRSGKLKTRPCRIYTTRMKSVTDCGDEIGSWLDNFLNTSGLRLVYHNSLVSIRTEKIDSVANPHYTTKDFGAFQDETSYMIITQKSLERLNKELERPCEVDSFRGSIVLEGTMEPFAEESWTFIRIGDKMEGPILKTAAPCFRCRVTTLDPTTGKFDPTGEPLKSALKLKRTFQNEKIQRMAKSSPILGVYFGLFHGDGKVINVGDPIYAALR